ncbi:hypothetical protein [Pseudescherichia vulneris]|uniref:hypothetical protein n=1 Tax=Pseudescherichia vulneris TaxID=566 RepID=UPI0030173CA3
MKDELQKILSERLNSPIYSYITFYLLMFNWKSISILFLSKKSVEDRIIAISTGSDLWSGLITPCLIGMLTAMASPYIHNGLAIVHRRAIEWNNKGLAREEIRSYERSIQVSAIKIRAENSDKLSQKRIELRESILIARKEKIDSGIVKLLDQAKKAEEDKNEFLTQYHRLYDEVMACEAILLKCNDIFLEVKTLDNAPSEIISDIKKRKVFSNNMSQTKMYSSEEMPLNFEDDIPF